MFNTIFEALTANNSPEDATLIMAFLDRPNRTDDQKAIDDSFGELLLEGLLTMTWDEATQAPVIKSEIHKLN